MFNQEQPLKSSLTSPETEKPQAQSQWSEKIQLNLISAEKPLSEQFEEFKETEESLTIEQLNKQIQYLKGLFKYRDVCDKLLEHCKENHLSLVRACKRLLDRTGSVHDKDNQVCVEGETGSGKSTLTLSMMMIIHAVKGIKFDLEKNVLYVPKEKELSTRLAHLRFQEDLWVDETIKSLNKQKWFNPDAIESAETIQTNRYQNNTIFYCLPSFNDLTSTFRNVNIKFRIWCMNQSVAVMRIKDIDCDVSDKWHTKDRLKLKGSYGITPLSNVDDRLQAERKLPGYVIDFSWPNLKASPDFLPIYFLYECSKRKSRLEKRVETGNENPITLTEKKKEAMLIHTMAVSITKGVTFIDYFESLGGDKCPIGKTGLLTLWKRAMELVTTPNDVRGDEQRFCINPYMKVGSGFYASLRKGL